MRTRMSGGVGAGRVILPATRFDSSVFWLEAEIVTGGLLVSVSALVWRGLLLPCRDDANRPANPPNPGHRSSSECVFPRAIPSSQVCRRCNAIHAVYHKRRQRGERFYSPGKQKCG